MLPHCITNQSTMRVFVAHTELGVEPFEWWLLNWTSLVYLKHIVLEYLVSSSILWYVLQHTMKYADLSYSFHFTWPKPFQSVFQAHWTAHHHYARMSVFSAFQKGWQLNNNILSTYQSMQLLWRQYQHGTISYIFGCNCFNIVTSTSVLLFMWHDSNCA